MSLTLGVLRRIAGRDHQSMHVAGVRLDQLSVHLVDELPPFAGLDPLAEARVLLEW